MAKSAPETPPPVTESELVTCPQCKGCCAVDSRDKLPWAREGFPGVDHLKVRLGEITVEKCPLCEGVGQVAPEVAKGFTPKK